MAYKYPLSLICLTDIVLPVFGDGDDEAGSVSTGVIVVVSVVGSIIVLFTLILCFHQCCVKPKQTVKPHRIRVVGVGQRTLPPSSIIPSAPPPARPCPIDPPPYHLYDDGFNSMPGNVNEPRDPFGRQQRPPIVLPTNPSRLEHPAPVLYTHHFGDNEHQSQYSPPPYTG